MKILVTGFDPFGGDTVNPALELIKQLPSEVDGCQIVTLEVPTVFHKSIETIRAAIELHQPDAVLSIGQAGGRPDMTVERVGINCDDARIPDNEGNSPVDRKIFEDGDDAYLLTLPIKAMVKSYGSEGIGIASTGIQLDASNQAQYIINKPVNTNDVTMYNCMLNGIRAMESTPSNTTFVNKMISTYGYLWNVLINNIETMNNATYMRFANVNVYGNFSQVIARELESILVSGIIVNV